MGHRSLLLLYSALLLCFAAPVAAQDVPSADGALAAGAGVGLPSACRPGAWDLGGASQNVSEEAAWNIDWMADIEDIAACLSHKRMASACVTVAGLADEKKFTLDVVRAFGSRRGAQEARARARSSRVISELLRLAVPSRQINELPPPRMAFYRGARIELVVDCLKDAVEKKPGVTPEELDKAVAEAVAAFADEVRVGGGGGSPQHLWAEAGLDLSLLASEIGGVFGPILSVGGGWSNELLYFRARVGLAIGTAEAQRIGFEVAGAIGYVMGRWPWLSFGIVAGDRFSAPGGDKPWLEQTLFFGVESTQCLFPIELWENSEACLTETLVPLGFRIRRGEVNGGRIERIPTTTNWSFRLDVALVARHDFL